MAICKGHEMLNALGMDSISCGATIAWAMEMVELGLLGEQQLDSETLRIGSADDVLRVIGKIAHREGVGELLAEGSLRAARTLGADAEARVVHVKGLEVAMHDPRAMPGMRRNYPVAPTGGDHTGAAGKRSGLRNTVGLCHFLQYDEATTLSLLNAATGWDVSPDELHATFERGVTMARLFKPSRRAGAGGRPPTGPLARAATPRTAARPAAQSGRRSGTKCGPTIATTAGTRRPAGHLPTPLNTLALPRLPRTPKPWDLLRERREPLPAGHLPYSPQAEENGAPAE